MCRIALCDDDADFAGQLKEYVLGYCRRAGVNAAVKMYTDSDELMETVLKRKFYDLYILDVMMPAYTGMDLLDTLAGSGVEAEVILLTSYTQYAPEACSYKQIFRYIPKEKFPEKMDGALDAFFSLMEKRKGRRPYVIQNRMRCVRFYQEDVSFISRDKKYVVFTMADGRKERVRSSLSGIQAELKNPDMVMLDRSYIVNIPHINRISMDGVTMDTGDILQTNRDHIRRLKEAFSRYWGEMI